MTPIELARMIARLDPDNEPGDPDDWRDSLRTLIYLARDVTQHSERHARKRS